MADPNCDPRRCRVAGSERELSIIRMGMDGRQPPRIAISIASRLNYNGFDVLVLSQFHVRRIRQWNNPFFSINGVDLAAAISDGQGGAVSSPIGSSLLGSLGSSPQVNRNADQPVQEHRCNDVETSVSEQNPDITPPLGKVNTDGDVGSCNTCGQNCRYQIIEGRDTIHEDPEAWKRGLRNKDTVKDITRHSENINCATLPPVSACSIPAMTMEQKVDVNIINTRTSKNIVPLRDGTQKNIGISFAWAFAHFV
ncbi:hypothetical protein DTO027B5_639 [Paecilomyces variotii]|nr:hypothetical protein DTO027B5_639 [Paecilomyces variotii]